MGIEPSVNEYYTSGSLWDRLREVLLDDGAKLEQLIIETLAPYGQFHG